MPDTDLVAQLVERAASLEDDALKDMYGIADAETGAKKWMPSPGPQTEAYYSEADVLLYGGEAGGGKSDLLHTIEHLLSLQQRPFPVRPVAQAARAPRVSHQHLLPQCRATRPTSPGPPYRCRSRSSLVWMRHHSRLRNLGV